MKVINKKITIIAVILLLTNTLFASEISFTGGYTKVSLQDGNHTVTLSGGAHVKSDETTIDADKIELYGEDYCYVSCTGNVFVKETDKNLTLKCPMILYDRNKEELLSDGWIEIEDLKNEVQLSGAWLDYSKEESLVKLQIKATIKKSTDDGLMTCTADSIEYNSDTQMVTLKGSSKVVWGDDTYKASIITVNLDTEEVILHGSISGEVNG